MKVCFMQTGLKGLRSLFKIYRRDKFHVDFLQILVRDIDIAINEGLCLYLVDSSILSDS